MLIRRHGMALTKFGTALALVAALLTATGWRADVHAQLPLQPVGSMFEMVGFIQNATVDTPGDPFSGGTITLNNHLVIVPKNTVIQMPATSMTWAELFSSAPAAYKALGQTGLALSDTPKPLTTFQVIVQGNRVEPAGTYIAGLLFLDQLSLMGHDGYINFIDYTAGDLYIGGTVNVMDGTRVIINDPIGRFGRPRSPDPRFTIDEENPTIKSETAYPMCVPRTNPAVADDPLCPQGNRPFDTSGIPKMIFTMPPAAAPSAAELASPSLRPVPLGGDPWRMAPFEVGDFITVKGPLFADAVGQYISAWGIDGNEGIFTTPGTLPAYVAVDVIFMGTGSCPAGQESCPQSTNVTLIQEAARRTRVEGFTTDISTAISINAIDVDACTGVGTDRLWAVQAVDPGAPTGAVAGRWRFRPGAPLFNLKGYPFLPPTREAHAFSLNGTVPAALGLTGLKMGEYTLPNFEFIGPENLVVGGPMVPFNFDTMPFLAQGEGPRDAFDPFNTGLPPLNNGVPLRQLSPWPGAFPPTLRVCPVPPIANAGASQTVASGAVVVLNGSASSDPNAPPLPLTFAWTQTAGLPLVTITTPTAAIAGFNAPTLAIGAAPVTLTFQLAVNNGAFTATATTTVTVNPPVVAPPIATAGASQTVVGGLLVTLNGSGSDPNLPPVGPLPLTFAWTQTAGLPLVTITNPTGAIAGFRAPTLARGSAPVILTFQLAVSNGRSTSTASTTVTVNPDATVPVVTALTTSPVSPIAATTVTVTLSAIATDNVGVTSVTFARNGTTIGVATAPTVAGGSTFTITIPKPAPSLVVLGVTVPTVFTATARDAAGNVSVVRAIAVVVR